MNLSFCAILTLFLFLFSSCSDHEKVMKEYKKGNKHAADLLLHGFQMKNSEHISSHIVDLALKGDQEAKEIIYAQIDTLRGTETHTNHTIVIPPNSGRK